MSFQQGLSGMNATSKNLEVIGNNIANANTYGAKAARAEFSDMYAASLNGTGGSAVGIGTQIASVSQQFTQGNISVTTSQTDLAINGGGFLQVGAVGDPLVKYTRNGQFKVVPGKDANGADTRFLADNNGLYLYGIPAGQTSPGPLHLPTGSAEAKITSQVSMEINLKADETPFPSTNRPASVLDLNKTGVDKTTHFATSQIAYDGKGQETALTYYFRKIEAGDNTYYSDPATTADRDSWEVYVTANGQATNDPMAPALIISFDARTGNSPMFQTDWAATPTAQAGLLTIPRAVVNGKTYQEIPDISLQMAGMTQFKASFGVSKLNQDGYLSGQLTNFVIEPDGQVTARYTNGQSKPAGQVQLVQFINPNGLQPLGGNLWASTVMSGSPTANNPGSGGTGNLQQGALEESNIDLTGELVKLITSQRIYQANAQTIKTIDQVLQTVVNLR
ncbi:MAG: flagellar hook protein FlgE [Rubrivivax sp.]|nr:flagellar hook protein FlgE [Rubrivivax sp.]